MRQIIFSAVLLLAVAGVGAAQELPEVERFGPQVGDTVPAFSLTDQTGATHTVDSIMGPNGAMLVFSRSADW